jgi:hypothetical protein
MCVFESAYTAGPGRKSTSTVTPCFAHNAGKYNGVGAQLGVSAQKKDQLFSGWGF